MHPPSPSRPRAGCRPLRSRAAVAWARAARRAAAGCAAASAASRLREVLACAGATSFWVAGPTGPISTTPSTSVRVRCPVGMYSLKPVRRGGMMNSLRWRDAATVLGQKSGIYPRFDSAAGLGQIPLIPGQIPYLILRVTGLDSASGPIPGNGQHCRNGLPLGRHSYGFTTATN